MAVLLSLSAELLQFIVDDLNVADIENFAASCRLFAEIAKAKRDLHLQRKKEYKTLTFHMGTLGNIETCSQRNAFIFLQDICRDDTLLFYPRNLEFSNFHLNQYCVDCGARILPESEVTRNREILGAGFTEAEKESIKTKLVPYFDEGLSLSLINGIAEGHYEVGMYVLLLLLQNVARLLVGIRPCNFPWFSEIAEMAGFQEGEVVKKGHYPSAKQQAAVFDFLSSRCTGMFKLPQPTVLALFHTLIEVRSPKFHVFGLAWAEYTLYFIPLYIFDRGIRKKGFSLPPGITSKSSRSGFSIGFFKKTLNQGV